MSKPISQAEARRLKARVRELEQEREKLLSRYTHDYPGVHIGSVTNCDTVKVAVSTAQRLGFAIAARIQYGNSIEFYAVKP